MKRVTKWRLLLHLQAKKKECIKAFEKPSTSVKKIGVENLFLFFCYSGLFILGE